jgi:hypothetical protein
LEQAAEDDDDASWQLIYVTWDLGAVSVTKSTPGMISDLAVAQTVSSRGRFWQRAPSNHVGSTFLVVFHGH